VVDYRVAESTLSHLRRIRNLCTYLELLVQDAERKLMIKMYLEQAVAVFGLYVYCELNILKKLPDLENLRLVQDFWLSSVILADPAQPSAEINLVHFSVKI